MPSCAPQQDCGSELITGGGGGDPAVAQSAHIKGHKPKVREVDLEGHYRRRGSGGEARPAALSSSSSMRASAIWNEMEPADAVAMMMVLVTAASCSSESVLVEDSAIAAMRKESSAASSTLPAAGTIE